MAKINNTIVTDTSNKTTRQGSGLYSKKTKSGGETFLDGHRSGTPASKSHRHRKPYKGQGK
jgi:sortase (surface protein transpeptidase)